jgi:hypothetical protein
MFSCLTVLVWQTAYADICELPAWQGTLLIDGSTAAAWHPEVGGSGSSATVSSAPGFIGEGVRFEYTLGSDPGSYAQARYDFPSPSDLTGYDIFGICLHGVAAPEGQTNRVRLMVADTGNVFYGTTIGDVGHVDRWMINLPVPKSLFTHQSWSQAGPIDWAHINRFFVVVEPTSTENWSPISTGSLVIDHVQATTAAMWPAPTTFSSVAPDPAAVLGTIEYVRRQKHASGLFLSWKDETTPVAWLYDQALVLLLLVREGRWSEADSLVSHLISEQQFDGRWPPGWDLTDPVDPAPPAYGIDYDWVGDQAWMVYALQVYASLSAYPVAGAAEAAEMAGDWLASRVDPDGRVLTRSGGEASTEGSFDTWMAMMSLGRMTEADAIAVYLLTQHWDYQLGYWWRGAEDPSVALNANLWLGEGFARHPRINCPEIALDALRFVRPTLATRSDDGSHCGLDFEGPVSVHSEGLGSYVVAGGPEAEDYLAVLKSLQREDGAYKGGVRGSPDNWRSGLGWLTSSTGLAPTVWLYFALTGSPWETYVHSAVDFDRDGDADEDDLALFEACASGPAVPYGPGCGDMDLHRDGDVDQEDFAIVQQCRSGPNVRADAACASACTYVSSVAQLRAAIDSLPPGARICLAPGTYVIDQTIDIARDWITIEGAGDQTVLELAPETHCPAVVIGEPVPFAPTITRRGVVLRSLVVRGYRFPDPQPSDEYCTVPGREYLRNNGITIRQAENCTIEDVRVEGAASGGIVLEQTCTGIVISNVTSSQNEYDAIAWDGNISQSRIEFCTLVNNGAAGISFDIGPAYNQVVDCLIHGNATVGVFIRDADWNCFQRCIIAANGEDGVFIANGDAPEADATDNAFIDNLYLDNVRNGIWQAGDRSVRNCESGGTFSGNGGLPILAVPEAPIIECAVSNACTQ